MRARTSFLGMGLVIALAACGGQGERQFGKADSEQIKQRTQQFSAAFGAKDLQKIGDFYAATTVMMPPNAATLHGRESISTYYKELMDNGVSELALDAKDVTGQWPLAFASGSFSMTRKAEAGEARDRGKFMLVFRNTAGQWRCEYQIWNSDLPPAAAAANQP